MTADAAFAGVFGRPPAASASAPGRVNLIGEHVDYTGGSVLPTVIEARVSVALAPDPTSGRVRVHAARFEETATRGAGDAVDGHWSDYVLAGHREAVELGLMPEGGADYLVASDVPHGAGVSSSAALLVALLRAATTRAGRKAPAKTVARWAQAVETDAIGVPCGVMDQMAVAAGRPGYAMALDTRTLAYEQVALPGGYAFPTLHSGLTRALSDGAYAERRAACQAAADALGLAALEELSLIGEDGARELARLPDALRRRARHCVTEHARVIGAVAALRTGDAEAFGALMNESHASMRDDFDIVPGAMDAMTTRARALGAVGSRLTGGGFGGCFVSCVPEARLAAWLAAMRSGFDGVWVVDEGRAPGS